MRLMSRYAVSMCVVLSLSGCGSNSRQAPVPTAPVSGTVTLGGKPLSGATVTFIAEGWSSVGKTNSSGEFKLVQGAAVGENKVTISKVDPSKLEGVEFSENPEDGLDEGQMMAANVDTKDVASADVPLGEMIGADYSNPAKTILTYNVQEGGTEGANFEL